MPEADTSNKSITKTLATHPLFIFSGYIIGVLGFIFSIYTQFANRTFPELTYSIHPVRTIVVKAGQVSRLKAIYDDKIAEADIRRAISRSLILL